MLNGLYIQLTRLEIQNPIQFPIQKDSFHVHYFDHDTNNCYQYFTLKIIFSTTYQLNLNNAREVVI